MLPKVSKAKACLVSGLFQSVKNNQNYLRTGVPPGRCVVGSIDAVVVARVWSQKGTSQYIISITNRSLLSFIPHSTPILHSSLWCSTTHQLHCCGDSCKSSPAPQLSLCLSVALLSSNSGSGDQTWKWTWSPHT